MGKVVHMTGIFVFQAACKGLEAAGLEVVSLTDVSDVNWGSQMPRKARRI